MHTLGWACILPLSLAYLCVSEGGKGSSLPLCSPDSSPRSLFRAPPTVFPTPRPPTCVPRIEVESRRVNARRQCDHRNQQPPTTIYTLPYKSQRSPRISPQPHHSRIDTHPTSSANCKTPLFSGISSIPHHTTLNSSATIRNRQKNCVTVSKHRSWQRKTVEVMALTHQGARARRAFMVYL